MENIKSKKDVESFVRNNEEKLLNKYSKEIAKEQFVRNPKETLDIVLKKHKHQVLGKITNFIDIDDGKNLVTQYRDDNVEGLKKMTKDLYPFKGRYNLDKTYGSNMAKVHNEYVLDNIEYTRDYLLDYSEDVVLKICGDDYADTIIDNKVKNSEDKIDIIATAFVNKSIEDLSIKGKLVNTVYENKKTDIDNKINNMYDMDSEELIKTNPSVFIITIMNYYSEDVATLVINNCAEFIQDEIELINN